MHLNDHLDQTGKSQAAFGLELVPPASQSLVSQWVRGQTRITLAYALQIAECTAGAVSTQDCLDMYRGTTPNLSQSPIPQPA